jgi:hypothetical protein
MVVYSLDQHAITQTEVKFTDRITPKTYAGEFARME